MGDLGEDTAVEALGDGRYRAHVNRDWEIWGPEGGYIASIALPGRRRRVSRSPAPRASRATTSASPPSTPSTSR